MKLFTVHADSTGESFDLMPSQLTPYNICTLFGLSKPVIIAQPSLQEATLADNLYTVPEDSDVLRVSGQPVPLPENKAQAKQRQNMMAGAKLRLVKTIKEEQDEVKKNEPTKKPSTTNRSPAETPPAEGVASNTQPRVQPQPVQQPAQPPPKPQIQPSTHAAEQPPQPVRTTAPRDDAVSPVEQPTGPPPADKKCRYCREIVPGGNVMLHEANCRRHKTECSQCGIYFTDAAMEAHIDEVHATYPCKHCNKQFHKEEHAQHEPVCMERATQCRHCEREMPMSVVMYHEEQCEAKVQKCDDCGMYITGAGNKMDLHKRECTARKQRVSPPPSDFRRDLTREVTRPGGKKSPVPTAGRKSPTPAPKRSNVGGGGSKPHLSEDEKLALKLQEEEYGAGGSPPSRRQDTAVPSEPTREPSMDADTAALIRRLQEEEMGSSGGRGGGGSFGGGGGMMREDTDPETRALIRAMQQQQQEEDERLARQLAGGGGGDYGGYGGGGGGGRGDGRGMQYGGTAVPHRLDDWDYSDSSSHSSRTAPRPRGGGGGRAYETDEELARRLAQEEYEN